MRIRISKKKPFNAATFLKKCGYHYRGIFRGEMSFARRLGKGSYPQFHIYINNDSEKELLLNLHLDAKKSSYPGVRMHAGEYEGKILKEEAERIEKIMLELS